MNQQPELSTSVCFYCPTTHLKCQTQSYYEDYAFIGASPDCLVTYTYLVMEYAKLGVNIMVNECSYRTIIIIIIPCSVYTAIKITWYETL